jgi:hypothetical protein
MTQMEVSNCAVEFHAVELPKSPDEDDDSGDGAGPLAHRALQPGTLAG